MGIHSRARPTIASLLVFNIFSISPLKSLVECTRHLLGFKGTITACATQRMGCMIINLEVRFVSDTKYTFAHKII